MKRQTKQQRIEQLESQISRLQRDSLLFEERLREARRRTVPINGGEMNFLPLSIERYEIENDVSLFTQADGNQHAMIGSTRVRLICAGDIVISHVEHPAKHIKQQKPIA